MLSGKSAARQPEDNALRVADLIVSAAVVMVIIFLYCAASPVLLKRRIEVLPQAARVLAEQRLEQISPGAEEAGPGGMRIMPQGIVASSPPRREAPAGNERDLVAFLGFVATFLEVLGVAGGVYCIVAGVCESSGSDLGEKAFVVLGGLLLFAGLSAPWILSKLLHLTGVNFPAGL